MLVHFSCIKKHHQIPDMFIMVSANTKNMNIKYHCYQIIIIQCGECIWHGGFINDLWKLSRRNTVLTKERIFSRQVLLCCRIVRFKFAGTGISLSTPEVCMLDTSHNRYIKGCVVTCQTNYTGKSLIFLQW